jgi:hypothetical protein
VRLRTSRSTVKLQGVGCAFAAPLYESGEWAVGGLPLRPQLMAEISRTDSVAPVGALGFDALSEFPWIVIDFTGNRLILGKP